MTRMQRIVALFGLVCLTAGLMLSMTGISATSSPRLLVVLGLMLVATWSVISLRRLTSKSLKTSLPLCAGSILVLALLVLANLLAVRHSARWDTTAGGRFTLSPQTKQVLAALPGAVEAVAFVNEEHQEITDLLTEYDAASRQLTFRAVDPDRHPEEAQAYGIREYGTVVVVLGDRSERITSPTEQSVTSALIRLTEDRRTSVYLVKGHGERAMSDDAKEGISRLRAALVEENYELADRLLLREGLPDAGDILIMAGPTTPLLPAEEDSLSRFVSAGGRLMLLLEPKGPAMPGVLQPLGITAQADVIVDASGVGSIFGMSEMVPLVAAYDPDHPLTRGFTAASFFPLCRSLMVAESPPESVDTSCLAFTSEASWGETGPLSGDTVRLDADEHRGPLCVAAAASLPGHFPSDSLPSTPEGRLVVVGDVDFLTNAFLDVSGNRDFAMNAVSWLAERSELIAIRPKAEHGAYLTLTSDAARSIFLLVVIVLPGAVLLTGIAVRLRRK